jgi:cytochrome o ubiquinol oxidase operon protein cyoD
MSEQKSITSQFEAPHGSLATYINGFVSCVVITLLAYGAAVSESIDDRTALAVIGGLAVIQCVIQLQKFLHLGTEFKPRWKLAAFVLMLVIVVIIVAGSLWIMSSLNYRMIHSPEQMYEFVESQNSI